LLRHSLARADLAQAVDDAVVDVLRSGLRTADILPREARSSAADQTVRLVGTKDMGDAVVAAVARGLALPS
jgi:hypothetical protein